MARHADSEKDIEIRLVIRKENFTALQTVRSCKAVLLHDLEDGRYGLAIAGELPAPAGTPDHRSAA